MKKEGAAPDNDAEPDVGDAPDVGVAEPEDVIVTVVVPAPSGEIVTFELFAH
jgi:hypothetical protein